jgi:predicted glycoside hydrolase/deacetylase ChbG (UPF0249 family)
MLMTGAAAMAGGTMVAAAQAPAGEIRLIVQGDDMGAAQAINHGTIRAYKEGVMRTTNIMLPTPWVLEAVRLLEENPGLDVGIHLTMTSEWSLVKWRPLTNAPSLVDANGNFFPMVRPNKMLPVGQSLTEAKPKLAEAEREIRAQIELGKKLVPRVSYMSTHMGFASPFPDWQEMLAKLSKEYQLPIPGKETGVQRLAGMYTNKDSAAERAAKIASRLETLEPGTWLTVDHAALDTPEMRAVHHPGYEHVAEDRWAVVQSWCSAQVKDVVRRRGIKLVGHRG